VFLRDLGEVPAARAVCDLAERHGADAVLLGLARAAIKAAQGQYAEAATEAEDLLTQKHDPPGDGQALYSAACVFSLASRAAAMAGTSARATELGDRGASLLADALDKGFHNLNYQEHNRMSDDPALEPIRAQPKVRELLAHRG
jgi:hypothetical protein